MSDDEIASYLRYKTHQKMCGRFSSTQLNRHIAQIPSPKMQPRWKVWLLLPLTLIGKMLNAQQDSVPLADSTQLAVENDTTVVQDSSLAMNDTTPVIDSTGANADTNVVEYEYEWTPPVIFSSCVPVSIGGNISIVLGGFGPIQTHPEPPFIPMAEPNAVTTLPKSKPDKMFIDGNALRPPVLPKEKTKDDPVPPVVPSLPWYSVLVPVPFRRKKGRNEK